MDQHIERLIRMAEAIIADDRQLPLDLMVKLEEAGIDLSRFN